MLREVHFTNNQIAVHEDFDGVDTLQEKGMDFDFEGWSINFESVLYLDLETCGIRNLTGVLNKFNNLETLILTKNPLDDQSVVHILKLISLKILEAEGTEISNAGFARLRDGLPGLEVYT